MTALGRSPRNVVRPGRARSSRKQPDCDGVDSSTKDAITALLVCYRGSEGFSAASYVKGQRVLGDGKQLIPVIIG